MVIHSIRAENFMRFQKLDISSLPERGLIGVEGPNESGKSTLGEVLLFVFFGRTRLHSEAPLASLIRWGADSMWAEVEFSIKPQEGAGCAYLVHRTIDRYGTNYVKVLDLPARKEVAAGIFQVADFIARTVHLDFQEFHDSFYHDQDDASRAKGSPCAYFESAAGMRHLRQAIEDLRREVEPFEREFGFFQKEIGRNLSQGERLARNAEKIPDLTARLARGGELIEGDQRKVLEGKRRVEAARADAAGFEQRARRIEQLQDADLEALPGEIERLSASRAQPSPELAALHGACLGSLALLAAAKTEHDRLSAQLSSEAKDGPAAEERRLASLAGPRRGSSFLSWALLILGLGLLAVVSVETYVARAGKLPTWAPEWHARLGMTILIGAGAASLSLLILAALVRRRATRVRSRALAQLEEARRRTAAMGADLASLTVLLEMRKVRDVPRLLQAAASSSTSLSAAARDLEGKWTAVLAPGDDARWRKLAQDLARSERDARSRLLGEAQKLERSLQEADAALKKSQSEKERLESELRECRAQVVKKESLEAKNRDLEESAGTARSEIESRQLAKELLEETAASLRSKIGPSLTRFVKGILPDLTTGRYREVRVSDGLEVMVYSGEKNDFLTSKELSGGTHEALGLALRLAVSHALVSARSRQAQFVFLDEPFKKMDSARAAATLRVLTRLSPDLEQFFVIRPDFSDEERKLFERTLRTSPDRHELIDGGSVPDPRPSHHAVGA